MLQLKITHAQVFLSIDPFNTKEKIQAINISFFNHFHSTKFPPIFDALKFSAKAFESETRRIRREGKRIATEFRFARLLDRSATMPIIWVTN